MTDSKDKHPLYRGPGQTRDDARAPRPPRRDDRQDPRMPNRAERAVLRPPRGDATDRQEEVRSAKPKEFRIYGLNACLSAFKARPDDLRKLWLLSSRIPKLQELLAFCVKNRIGYNVVENEDLEKLTGSAHHEGICMAMLPQPELNLSQWLMSAPAGACLLLWLDGVGNPHNLGAIMRSAAHFGVYAILLPKSSSLSLSGAAARVAEGGAEHVPLIRLGRTDNAIAQLASAGFTLVSTVVRGGNDVFRSELPARCVMVMGAEQTGVDSELIAASCLRVEVPGTGQVESLNVSAAAAVLLAEWRRQNGGA